MRHLLLLLVPMCLLTVGARAVPAGAEVIRAATYWPSVAMKFDRDVGTITPGKYADIIAVRGDALRCIALLQRVDVVVKRAVKYKG
jgi:imidazolonepropionase-like amidohydrolase